jgi:hypothetical protein
VDTVIHCGHVDLLLQTLLPDQLLLLFFKNIILFCRQLVTNYTTPLKNAHIMHQAIPNAQLIVYEQG